MLPSSVRRVASSITPQSASPLLSGLTSTLPRASIVATCRPTRHQRRCSSSKPSSPANGPKDVPAGGQVPTTSSSSTSTTASTQPSKAGERRKRKSKEPQQAAGPKLPSVPSTQHLPLESLALSSFFSQHRPISITHSLPKAITDDAFASIFLPRLQGQKSTEVMDTLSKVVKDLEAPMGGLSLGGGAQEVEAMEDNDHKIELKHPDGSESSVYVQLNAMSGQFLPFSPPPAPVLEAEAAESRAETVVEEEVPQHRVYKAVLTIEEQTDADGQVKIVAHSPHIIEDPPVPRTFLERMAVRHLRYEDAQGHRDILHALSVVRRRKLKMKKKKYKKLMKKTRNLRRKLDRA